MPLPAAWAHVTVTGQYLNRDGTPAAGRVVFLVEQFVVVESLGVVPSKITATLDATGAFSVSLPATNDPQCAPINWTYTVQEKIPGGRDDFALSVPYNTVGSINLITAIPAADNPTIPAFNDAPSDGTLYGRLNGAWASITASILATVLTGLSLATGTAITAADSVLSAFGKLQKQITDLAAAAAAATAVVAAALGIHTARTDNPHSVTKAQVGLTNADNTSDANKPVSVAQAAADTAAQAAAEATAAAALTAHGLAADPHPGYLTTAEGAAVQAAAEATAAAALSVHAAAADPHPGYVTTAEGAALQAAAEAASTPIAHVGTGGGAHANVVAAGAAGFMTGADKTKLDGVAAGATANDTDANLRARASHTGTQLASTISDFAATALTAAVSDAIANGEAKAPSQNAVFDALVLKLDATATTLGKHLIPIMANAMAPSAAGGCAAVAKVASGANLPDIITLNFDPGTQEYAQFAIAMPKSWNEGTVTARFRWSHATAATFDVIWGLQAVAVSNDDTVAVAFGTAAEVTDSGGTTDDLYVSGETSAITIAGTPQAEDTVFFRVYRKSADGSDTLNVDARLHGIDLFYTTDAGTDA